MFSERALVKFEFYMFIVPCWLLVILAAIPSFGVAIFFAMPLYVVTDIMGKYLNGDNDELKTSKWEFKVVAILIGLLIFLFCLFGIVASGHGFYFSGLLFSLPVLIPSVHSICVIRRENRKVGI